MGFSVFSPLLRVGSAVDASAWIISVSGFGGKVSEVAVNPWLPYLLLIRSHLGERQETLVLR